MNELSASFMSSRILYKCQALAELLLTAAFTILYAWSLGDYRHLFKTVLLPILNHGQGGQSKVSLHEHRNHDQTE
jgi:hypothetical protein